MRALTEGARFAIVGGVQVLLDSAIYIALTTLGIATPPANLCGRVGGALLGFWLNGKVTFTFHPQPALRRRLARYVLLWLVMTIVSTTALTWIAHDAGLIHSWWSKPLLETMLGLVSFLASRHWVYRDAGTVATEPAGPAP
jgi:putative flippase GtrA